MAAARRCLQGVACEHIMGIFVLCMACVNEVWFTTWARGFAVFQSLGMAVGGLCQALALAPHRPTFHP